MSGPGDADPGAADGDAQPGAAATGGAPAVDRGRTVERPGPTDPRTLAAVYLKGAAMGAADTIPGVSGGTIALVTGIYERFVRALTRLDPAVLTRLPTLHTREGRQALAADLRAMDAAFLAALGLGIVTALLTLSRVVHAALVGYRAHTFAFFFGLIAASAVVLYDAVSVDTPGRIAAAGTGVVVAFLLTGASAGDALGNGLPVVFGAGAVAVSAMVLPGISGSFLLLLLGQYTYLTGTLTRFVDAVLATAAGGSGPVLALGAVVAAFVAGAALGLLTVAHAVRRALDAYRAATLAFLVSLMVGSLRLPVAEVVTGVGRWTPAAAGSLLAAAALGAAVVLALDRYTDDLSY